LVFSCQASRKQTLARFAVAFLYINFDVANAFQVLCTYFTTNTIIIPPNACKCVAVHSTCE
jgi:hypothetical protein